MLTITFDTTQNKRFNREQTNKRKHLIPSLIIATFILSYCIPDLTLAFADVSLALGYMLNTLWTVGIVTDALIYVFLYKKTRDIAVSIMSCGRYRLEPPPAAIERSAKNIESRKQTQKKEETLEESSTQLGIPLSRYETTAI